LSKSRYWPADQMAVMGQLSLPAFSNTEVNANNAPSYALASNHGMFLTESGQAIVLRSYDNGIYPLAADSVASSNGAAATPRAAASMMCPQFGCRPMNIASRSRLDILDVAGNAPVAVTSLEVAGRLLDARRNGNSVWLVTNQAFVYPSFVRWWPDRFDYQAPAAVRKSQLDQLIAANTTAIRASVLRDWLPNDPTVKVAVGAPTPAECAQYRKVSEPSEIGWLRVASINLADRSVSQQIIMAQGQMVYASAKALYVGTPNFRP
jgi:Beta propeller domain